MFFQDRIISLERAESLCEQLAEKVVQKPIDIVVSIEHGGWFVGVQLARFFQVPHATITVRRLPDEKVLDGTEDLSVAHRLFVVFIADFFRMARKPVVIEGVQRSMVCKKNILLVDDAVHTGSTMEIAAAYLREQGVETVSMAALASVRGPYPPLCYVLEGHHCYPWSKLSVEYKKFQNFYHKTHVAQ